MKQKITVSFDMDAQRLPDLEKFLSLLCADKLEEVSTAPAEEPAWLKPIEAQTEEPALKPIEAQTEKAVTITDIRTVATKLAAVGKNEVISKVFKTYGAKKLSEINAKDYAACLEDLEAAYAS